MSDKTTSLDIQKGKWSMIDITSVFPITNARTLDLARHGEFLDGIIWGENTNNTLDVSGHKIIHITRFRTLQTLDIALPEVVNPALWQQWMLDMVPRPRILDIVPPLYVPYWSLDLRHDRIIKKENTYADIFARTLPYWLFARRITKATQAYYSNHRKQIFLTIIGIFIFIIPVLSYVVYALNHGYSTLETITETRDPNTIRTIIRSARWDFERANFLFTPFSWIPLDQIDLIRRLSAGWLALTRWLDIIVQAIPNTLNSSGTTIRKDTQDILSYRVAAKDIFLMETLGIANPTDWIIDHEDDLRQARDEFIVSWDIYSGIRPTGERTLKMQSIGFTLGKLAGILDWSLNNKKDILNMLWHTNPQRYIVFNQNRDEIRANWGFPGSILSFTLYKWNILDYRGDDVYYYDWNLYPYKEIPPPGIALLTDNYGLRDVNYYPDFHETLDKANRFIERSGEATVTTWIAIHQGIVEDILAKIWPVTVSGVTIPFDNNNFSLLMSTLVEWEYGRANTPKDILFQFVSAFVLKIRDKNAVPEFFDIFNKYLKNGEILFASRDPEIDAFLANYRKKLPWELSSPNWVYPVWTSVSGNKSDRYISRIYQAETSKIDECKYENTITLTTTHTLKKSDQDNLDSYFQEFGISDPDEKAKLDFIQWNGKNRSYVRVYVPLGASIIGAGSDIKTVSNEYATVFSLLIETPVGTTSSKSWKYALDIPNCIHYNNQIDWTIQPGLREVKIK